MMASSMAAQANSSELLLQALKQKDEQQEKIMEIVKKTLEQVQQMKNGSMTGSQQYAQQLSRSQRTGRNTAAPRDIFNMPMSRLSLAEKMAIICKDYNAQCADSKVL